MSFNPLVKIATLVAAVPTSLTGTSMGVFYLLTPNKAPVNQAHEVVKDLEDQMNEKVNFLVRELFTDKVDNLDQLIKELGVRIGSARSLLDFSSNTSAQDLNSKVEDLEILLKESMLDSKEKTEAALTKLKLEVQEIERSFNSELSYKLSNSKSKITAVDNSLEEAVKEQVDKAESDIRKYLKDLRDQIFELEVFWKPSSLGKCHVALEDVSRDKIDFFKEEYQWRLEDFVQKISGNQDLIDKLKARCYDLNGVGKIVVTKSSEKDNSFSYSNNQSSAIGIKE